MYYREGESLVPILGPILYVNLVQVFYKKHRIGVSLPVSPFGNFRVKFEENLPIFCSLYKKFLRFWKRALSVS